LPLRRSCLIVAVGLYAAIGMSIENMRGHLRESHRATGRAISEGFGGEGVR
jgi:hypothetical protein